MKSILTLFTIVLLCGCQTFYSNVVTITQIRESALTELGTLYKNGMISPETDQKIEKADAQFRASAHTLEIALIAYKTGQTTVEPVDKLLAVRESMRIILDILAPLITEAASKGHYNDLNKATQL